MASAQTGSTTRTLGSGRDQVAHSGLWVAARRRPELTGDATPALPAPPRSLLRAVTCQAVTKYVPFPSLAGPISRRPPRASGLPLGRPLARVSRCPSGKVGCPGGLPVCGDSGPLGGFDLSPPALHWPSCRALRPFSLPSSLCTVRDSLVVSAATPRGCGSPGWAGRWRAQR